MFCVLPILDSASTEELCDSPLLQVRFKCIEGILLACNTLAIGVMGFLLWPTRAEAYFQIGSYEFSPVGAAPYDDI